MVEYMRPQWSVPWSTPGIRLHPSHWEQKWNEMVNEFQDRFHNDRGNNAEIMLDEDGNHVIELEVPGFEREDLDVRFDDRTATLTVVGSRDTMNGGKRTVEYRRTIPGCEPIDARVENGMLRVSLRSLEKAVSDPNGRSIEIK